MRFDEQLLLKWLDGAHPQASGLEFKVINHCVFWAKDVGGYIRGVAVVRERDFNTEVIGRMTARMSRPENRQLKFGVILPPGLRERFERSSLPGAQLEVTYSPFIHVRHGAGFFTLRTRLRVTSVDDSAVLLKLLKRTMDEIGFIDVIGQISDPANAVTEILRNRPDVVTLDIQMPRMNGVEVLKNLLRETYYPVLMVSSLNLEEGSMVFDALNAGAFDYLSKPKHEELAEFTQGLSERLLQASVNEKQSVHRPQRKVDRLPIEFNGQKLLWCIGSSTGGTQALTEIFRSLPAEIPPTLVVQHIPPVFSRAFAKSLNDLCPFSVKEAEDGEEIKHNHVYIAAGGLQMGIIERDGLLRISLRDVEPVNRFKPSVDYLFKDLAKLNGFKIVAGILTGMGRDGAEGLLELKKRGAMTFAQDEASSAVYGMPRAAVEIGAVDTVTPLEQIAQTWVGKSLLFKKAG
jgi:two-component system chemotaxis response regulator CheB